MTGNLKYLFDENVIKLARIFEQRYPNVGYIGKPGYYIALGEEDRNWIPVAGKVGWVCITKDMAMLEDPKERRVIVISRLRLVVLMEVASESVCVLDNMLSQIWDDIPSWVEDENPPWVARIYLDDEQEVITQFRSSSHLQLDWASDY